MTLTRDAMHLPTPAIGAVPRDALPLHAKVRVAGLRGEVVGLYRYQGRRVVKVALTGSVADSLFAYEREVTPLVPSLPARPVRVGGRSQREMAA